MELLSLLIKNLPLSFPEECRIFNLRGSSAALVLALGNDPFVAIEKDESKAGVLRKDIMFYRSVFGGNAPFFLPDPDGPGGAGLRAGIIHDLGKTDSLVTSSKNLRASFWDKDSLARNVLSLGVGQVLSRLEFEESLLNMGYAKVPMVSDRGEYSRREWIVDIFPSTSEVPLRIEFFGDEIEKIRTFDIGTQRSDNEIKEFLLLPAREQGEAGSLSDITPASKYYCLYAPKETEDLPEKTVFFSRYSFEAGMATDEEDSGDELLEIPQVDAGLFSIKGLGILAEERKVIEDLPRNINKLGLGTRIIIIASTEGQAERLKDIFRDEDIIVPVIDIKELSGFIGRISITVGDLSSGVFMDGVLIITEKELFGERTSIRPARKSKLANLIVSVDDITPGDYVVHRDHGIGRFTGVVRQNLDETELELLTIEYENGRLYIPIQNIQIISKYRVQEGAVPRTDSLGGKTWQKKKEKARKKIHEMAARLLDLYAGRKIARGYTFSPDTEMHREFDSFFTYDETPDQLKAIAEIKKDMESEKPMDRLICGDVGYGKTEVAIRAVFKAIYDNRQVAVLVPTTILAEQHYRTFRERFSGFPVTIDYISRFKSRKLIDLALKGISTGEIDILIGTHGLLSKKIAFNRLGLLVVDEEHRFGVGQKEKIKELAKNIDVLNMTATPIPRTLHMALSGIRDISVIETPPEERLAVKSVVTVINDKLIKETVTAELQRNGQVFFVHNRIHDIYKMAHHIQGLVPSAKIGVAHGQMPEKELEEVMHKFFEGEIDILVSTSIVGSGLDVPRANTIIINMADRMGLADLYQLRGRVGRSSRKGYAYFLAPPESSLTEDARKRLQAVQEMSYLGAGFRLALKDLEIRGAGDIFGPDQSGHIHEIGFDLYIEMLENAVAELKGIDIKEELDPLIEMKTSAFIPEEYIEDISLRLSFYRRVASLKTEKDVSEFEAELNDRFGRPPEEVVNLTRVMRLKILARRLMITKIQESGGKARVVFSPETTIQPPQIFDLQKNRKKTIKFLQDGFELDLKETYKNSDGNFERVFEAVEKTLLELCESVGISLDGPSQEIL